uniref:Lipoprotein n=1 Tax=Heterorhabditis bacteriophora TaxID=37862 RepID=A0A1I7XLV0_HETBA
MAIWCLATTIFTSVARVPRNYAVSELIDAQLKRCTPKENGRYTVDKSTPEQTAQQNQILTSISTQLGITQAECDQAGRNK